MTYFILKKVRPFLSIVWADDFEYLAMFENLEISYTPWSAGSEKNFSK